MSRAQQGFTLIELMIVVAIIGILAAIALPAYQDYIAKSQLTAGLAEVRSGKTAFESYVLAESVATFDLADIGLQSTTPRCTLSMNPGETGFIRCTVKGNPKVAGQTVELVRSASSVWECKVSAGVAARLLPTGCTQ